MAVPVELRDDLLQGQQKSRAILIVFQNIFALISTQGGVAGIARKLYADEARHHESERAECAIY